jgi:hypothetical protein
MTLESFLLSYIKQKVFAIRITQYSLFYIDLFDNKMQKNLYRIKHIVLFLLQKLSVWYMIKEKIPMS